MSQQLLNAVTKSYMKNDLPEFRAGDTVKVHVRIKEGDKERIAQLKKVKDEAGNITMFIYDETNGTYKYYQELSLNKVILALEKSQYIEKVERAMR